MKTQKFFVDIKEVHNATVEVEVELINLETTDELEKRVREAAMIKADNLDSLDIEYSHTLDPETWTVTKA